MENLYQQLDKAETPEARASIAEQIRAISGREAPNRYTVVPGGQEWDAAANAMRTVPSRVFNNQAGQFVEQSGGVQQGDISTDSRAIEIRDNPNMTREQKVAALRALGYS